jgi:ubiquinone/menaquinone biosynthesis C-methylase UbiE
VTESPAGIAGVFDRAADSYDAVGVPWFGPIAAGLVDELAVRPGERVLDIGCGRGAALLPLARAAGPTGSALGIDLAPAMVARTAADAADLPWVEVRVADASAPDVTGTYDVLSCCLVLFFLPDPAAAVRRWVDLLEPGGRMGITTFGPQDERWKAVDAVFSPYLPQQMRDARTTGARGPFASDEGMEQLLTEAGLRDVRTAHREVTAEFADPQQWLDFSWSHGQRAMWEAVPVEEHDAVRGHLVELLEGFAPLGFSQQVRHTLGRRP